MSETQAVTAPADTIASAPTVHAPIVHAPGTFCWWEIGTTDLDAAKAFYTGLFGWTYEEHPMDNGEVYVMMKHKGQDLLGLYELNPEQLKQGIPPHWLAYIAVEQADQTVAMATSLGGTAVMPAFDVMEHGRMSVLRDPQGATFAVWQAKQHPGAGIVNDNGSVCWTELATTDRAAAGAFYSKLFGYDIKEMDMEGSFTYSVLRKDEADKGGILEITEDWGDVPPHFANYVGVADCDARAAQAEALGGKVVVPPMDIPNVGRFANLQDPLGAHFSIITFEMPAGA